jgi:hypothetical protein
MKKLVLGSALLLASMNAMAFGEVGQWSSGWGQGVSEYTAVSVDGNSIYIACQPDKDMYMSVKVGGEKYDAGFDLVIDGELFKTPYDTKTTEIAVDFPMLWVHLRKAKNIQVKTHDGKTASLPSKGSNKTLPAVGSPDLECSVSPDLSETA